jgi:hypothetical protein
MGRLYVFSRAEAFAITRSSSRANAALADEFNAVLSGLSSVFR